MTEARWRAVNIYGIVVALDDFQEQSRSVLHVLGEQLQQVPVVVEVDQNAQLLKL